MVFFFVFAAAIGFLRPFPLPSPFQKVQGNSKKCHNLISNRIIAFGEQGCNRFIPIFAITCRPGFQKVQGWTTPVRAISQAHPRPPVPNLSSLPPWGLPDLSQTSFQKCHIFPAEHPQNPRNTGFSGSCPTAAASFRFCPGLRSNFVISSPGPTKLEPKLPWAFQKCHIFRFRGPISRIPRGFGPAFAAGARTAPPSRPPVPILSYPVSLTNLESPGRARFDRSKNVISFDFRSNFVRLSGLKIVFPGQFWNPPSSFLPKMSYLRLFPLRFWNKLWRNLESNSVISSICGTKPGKVPDQTGFRIRPAYIPGVSGTCSDSGAPALPNLSAPSSGSCRRAFQKLP